MSDPAAAGPRGSGRALREQPRYNGVRGTRDIEGSELATDESVRLANRTRSRGTSTSPWSDRIGGFV
jgi:hypothetical protein